MFRLAIEKHEPGACYHATAEEEIAFKQIAEAVGQHLGVPVASVSPDAAAGHFGWLMAFVGKDMSASNVKTKKRLGWHPSGPELIADLQQMHHAKP